MGTPPDDDPLPRDAGSDDTAADSALASLARELSGGVSGEVLADRVSRGLYATDASLYEEEPVAVVVPASVEDVSHVHRVALERGVPVLPRGGGTSLAGQATGRAIVVDTSKHLRRVLEVDVPGRTARVEPGVVRDELNAALGGTGLHFAPETATTDRATIGGMVGNNSSGTRSIRYGKTIDHLLELDVLLITGEHLHLRPLSRREWDGVAARDDREGRLYRTVREVVERHRDEIERRYPKLLRRVGGYNLDAFPPEGPWNLAHLVCGSEGTLATVLGARVGLVPVPEATALCAVHYDSLDAALRSVPRLLEFGPSAVELLDRTLLELTEHNVELRRLADFLEGAPEAILLVELPGESAGAVEESIRDLARALSRERIGTAHPLRTDAAGQERVWKLRKAGLGILMSMRGDRKPLPFIEDAAVPVESLADYIADVRRICDEEGVPITMYAHASVGLLHVRPILDLRRREDVERMRRISERAFERVLALGGAWSGEHGDGRVRGPSVEPFFGPELYGAFRTIKRAFDPPGLLNPGKIVGAPPIDTALRIGPHYRPREPRVRFHYRDEGGYAAAVERCSGIGACRKTLAGTMCPSYRVTRDERHTTRGRANALRLAMTGALGPEAMTGEGLYAVMDLCLSCKACATECPSGVDLARLKSEFLAGWYDRHGAPPRARLFGEAASRVRRVPSLLLPLVSLAGRRRVVQRLVARRYGLAPGRELPRVAPRSFPRRFRSRRPPRSGGAPVALFADTYLGWHEPRIGEAAVRVLEALGHRVELADVGCCQRPRLSLGFLDDARREGSAVLERLDAFAGRGVPIVVCEPSCVSALTHDLPDLVEDGSLAKRVAGSVVSIDRFLARAVEEGRLAGRTDTPFLLHGHCHQKALDGTGATLCVLEAVSSRGAREVDSGCCGMAGSFGYEREHHELSLRIAEERLLPAVRSREPGTGVVANGFSCRHQIRDAASVEAVHVVEAVASALEGARS